MKKYHSHKRIRDDRMVNPLQLKEKKVQESIHQLHLATIACIITWKTLFIEWWETSGTDVRARKIQFQTAKAETQKCCSKRSTNNRVIRTVDADINGQFGRHKNRHKEKNSDCFKRSGTNKIPTDHPKMLGFCHAKCTCMHNRLCILRI